MSHSRILPLTVRCPRCDRSLELRRAIVLDLAGDPEVARGLWDGTFDDIVCPCGEAGRHELPLLVYRQEVALPLVFSPQRHTTNQQDTDHFAQLCDLLAESLGSAWCDAWGRLPWVGYREDLPALLTRPLPPAQPERVGAVATLMGLSDSTEIVAHLEQHPTLLDPDLPALIELFEEACRVRGMPGEAEALVADARLIALARAEGVAALADRTIGHWPPALLPLAQAMDDAFESARADPDALERALDLLWRIVRHPTFPDASREARRRSRGHLQVLLGDRLRLHPSLDDLERIRELADADLAEAHPAIPSHLGTALGRAGLARMRLFDHQPDPPLLQEAVVYLRRAVHEVEPHPGQDRARRWLAQALRKLGAARQEVALLDEGLATLQVLLAAEQAEEEEAASAMVLPQLLGTRYDLTGDPADLDAAIDAAARLPPDADPTTRVQLLQRRFRAAGDPHDLEQADALTARTCAALAGRDDLRVEALATRSALDAMSLAWRLGTPPDARRAALEAAASAAGTALAAVTRRERAQARPRDKLVALRNAEELAVVGAHALAALGRPGEAVDRLEQARGRLFAAETEAEARDLAGLADGPHAALLHRHRAARDAVAAAEGQLAAAGSDPVAPDGAGPSELDWADRLSEGAELGQSLRDAHRELQATIEALQDVPGLEGFHRPVGLAELQAAAQAADATLVYLAPTPVCTLALIVDVAGCRAVELPLTRAELDTVLVRRAGGVDGSAAAPHRAPADPAGLAGPLSPFARADDLGPDVIGGLWAAQQGWADLGLAVTQALEQVTARLAEPLQQALGPQPARTVLALVPLGGLALLPLAAAMPDRTVTLLPTGAALGLAARRLQRASPRRVLAGAADPVTDASHLARLAWALREHVAVAARFDDDRMLTDRSATLDAVWPRLASATHLHFACHGTYDRSDPLAARLHLAAGTALTAQRVRSELHAPQLRLVVLSACRTGVADTEHVPGEALGLSLAFLQAGAAGVLCTLWSVYDSSTMIFVDRFYEMLLGDDQRDPLPPPVALRRTQAWARSRTRAQLTARYGEELGSSLRELVPFGTAPPWPPRADDRPLSDPVHWAGFVLLGL